MSIGRVPGATGIQPSIVDAKGDLIVATAADSVDRLAVGTNEQRLVADSTVATGLKYVADTTNYAIAAKGDLLVGTAADTVSALTVGSANQVLTVDSSTATGLKWAATSTPNFVGAFIYNTGTNTAIPTGTSTIVAMQAESIDTDGFHSTTTNTSRITIPSGKAGKYFVSGQAQWASSENGNFELALYKNGAFVNGVYVRQGGTPVNQVNTYLFDLAVGDYIEIRVYQSSGIDRNLVGTGVGNGPVTYLSAIYLGA